MIEYINAKEAHKRTNETLDLMYHNSMEKIFNAILEAIKQGKYFVSIDAENLQWFGTEYENEFVKTMEKLGYKVCVSNGDFSHPRIDIDW